MFDRLRQHVSRTIYRGSSPECNERAGILSGENRLPGGEIGALVFIIFVPVPYGVAVPIAGGLDESRCCPSVILGLYLRMLSGGRCWGDGCRDRRWNMVASTTSFKPRCHAVCLRHQFSGLHRLVGADRHVVVSVHILSALLKHSSHPRQHSSSRVTVRPGR